MNKQILVTALALGVCSLPATGQITSSDMYSNSAMDLATLLIDDPSIAVNSATYTGAWRASGSFSGGSGILSFEDGVILTTGSAASAAGPNNSIETSTYNHTAGDSDLDGLIPGYYTSDASILEIVFTPIAEIISFQFIFASEEYNEWVGSEYNDVFGFFLNGENIALLPNTNTPVSINNINAHSNSSYYTNNAWGGLNIEYDGLVGLSTGLYASGHVIAGEQNTIKLAIADAGDSILDSAVFIKEGSFTNTPPPSSNAVPEPSTYGLLGAMALLGLILKRRLRR